METSTKEGELRRFRTCARVVIYDNQSRRARTGRAKLARQEFPVMKSLLPLGSINLYHCMSSGTEG